MFKRSLLSQNPCIKPTSLFYPNPTTNSPNQKHSRQDAYVDIYFCTFLAISTCCFGCQYGALHSRRWCWCWIQNVCWRVRPIFALSCVALLTFADTTGLLKIKHQLASLPISGRLMARYASLEIVIRDTRGSWPWNKTCCLLMVTKLGGYVIRPFPQSVSREMCLTRI